MKTLTFINQAYHLNKPVFYFLFFYTLCSQLKAQQNLVPNGSFEILSDCPMGADIEKAIGWFSPSDGTPDLFNTCANPLTNVSVPLNAFGFQYAQEGSGYVGLVPYSYNVSPVMYREYIEIKLLQTLQKNELYKINFYYNLANNSPVASNNISCGFFKDTAHIYNSDIVSPPIQLENTLILSDTLGWALFETYYQSQGDENYFIIGNFIIDNLTDTFFVSSSGNNVYYYIDNISVSSVQIELENVFTPNNDGINDLAFYNKSLSFYHVDILNRWGELIKTVDFNVGWNGEDEHGNNLLDGIYYYRVYNSNQSLKTGFIQLVR